MSTYPSDLGPVFDSVESAKKYAAASRGRFIKENEARQKLSIRLESAINSKLNEIAKLEGRNKNYTLNRLLSLGIRSYLRTAKRLLSKEGVVPMTVPGEANAEKYASKGEAILDSNEIRSQADRDADDDLDAFRADYIERN